MGQIQRVRQMRPADGTGTQSRVSEEIILINQCSRPRTAWQCKQPQYTDRSARTSEDPRGRRVRRPTGARGAARRERERAHTAIPRPHCAGALSLVAPLLLRPVVSQVSQSWWARSHAAPSTRWARRGRRPSSAAWRLALLLGDERGRVHLVGLQLEALPIRATRAARIASCAASARASRRGQSPSPAPPAAPAPSAVPSTLAALAAAAVVGDARGHRLEELLAERLEEDGRARRDAQVDPPVDQDLVLRVQHLRPAPKEGRAR